MSNSTKNDNTRDLLEVVDDLFAGSEPGRRGRPNKYTPTQRAEMNRRRGEASSVAKTALTRLHKDEYTVLYQEVLKRLEEVRGPIESY